MKKCASCTKDLPDAALHCVFCGAKQPPAPAVPQSAARTAFGYSGNDRADQMRQTRRPATVPPRPTAAGPAMPPSPALAQTVPAVPSARPQPPIATPPPKAAPLGTPRLGPAGPPGPPPFQGAPAQGGLVAASPNAKTVFAGAPAAANARTVMAPPAQSTGTGPAAAMATTPAPAPHVAPVRAVTAPPLPPRNGPPIIAIPDAQPPPYLASQTASRLIRPVEPWHTSMRVWMIVWGLGLFAAFCTPVTTSPLVFPWSAVLDGAGTERLPSLMLVAVGVLGLVLAIGPMPSVARGVLAAALGIAGVAVPIALGEPPAWQDLAALAGMLILVPALLVRSEYRDSILPRLLVTLGAAGVLVPLVLPQDGEIPLVRVLKELIDMPGPSKVEPAITLGAVTLAIVSLLAWLPAPATGASKVWAWILILWALVSHVAHLAVAGDPLDAAIGTPNATLVAWVAGSPGVLGSAYLAFAGYGLASLIGKQLE